MVMIKRLFGFARTGARVAKPQSGLLSGAKKIMGSSFGQAVLWAAVPTLAMGLFDKFSHKA